MRQSFNVFDHLKLDSFTLRKLIGLKNKCIPNDCNLLCMYICIYFLYLFIHLLFSAVFILGQTSTALWLTRISGFPPPPVFYQNLTLLKPEFCYSKAPLFLQPIFCYLENHQIKCNLHFENQKLFDVLLLLSFV